VAVEAIDLEHLFLSEPLGLEPVGHVNVLVGESDRGVTMVVTRRLLIEHTNVLALLVLIDGEVEVGAGLDLLEELVLEAITLLLLKLILEAEGFELLVKQGRDAALYILHDLVVIVVDLGDVRKDALLLLSGAERGQPVDLRSVLSFLLLRMSSLGVRLEGLPLASVEGGVGSG
jgi:hypothetical protein